MSENAKLFILDAFLWGCEYCCIAKLVKTDDTFVKKCDGPIQICFKPIMGV